MTFQELQDLLRQDPGRWPLPVRLGVIGTFFVVFSIALIYFAVWSQKKDELAQFQSEEQTLRQEFKTKQAKAVNLDLYREQLDEIQKSFGNMLRQLPGATEMAELLRDVSQVYAQSGLTQERFKTLEEEPKDFYALVPIEIRLKGSYHQLADFVSSIAELSRIVTLHNVAIKQDKNPDQLQMDVVARTYRYLDEAEIAAADAAKKKPTVRGSSSASGSE
jgi:type IV pilus assembly protein PilO